MTIIYPMFAMVLLTMVVGLTTAYIRIRSAYAGEVDRRYFKLMGNYDIPEHVAKFGRNFNNLLEVPMLFYAAGVCAIAMSLDSALLLYLAWVFVVLRIVHSAIHLTYNHPMHRFVPFLLSFLCVVAMWACLVVSVARS